MATFKVMVRKDRRKVDKSYVVYIRFTHNRRTTYLPTSMVAERGDLTSSLKIKNWRILDRGEELIRVYRKKIEGLYLEINDVPWERIVDTLKRKGEAEEIDFVGYARKWLGENEGKRGIKNYATALRAFLRWMGRDVVYCSEFTVGLMRDFERSLAGKARAQSLYTSAIMKIYRDARDWYNDYDEGVIRIRASLSGYRAPKQNVAVKRAVGVEVIRKMMGVELVSGSRAEMARDCFLMSFCLMGMNAVDLYGVREYDGRSLTYNRTKTRDRRSDGALMVVDVPDVIRPIMGRYMVGARGGCVFDFSARYSTPTEFTRALNIGLKQVGRVIGVDGLQFYCARHSMATIAVNEVRIPIYTVNDMLCHVDEGLRVTNLYVKKDFSLVNEANVRLMEYVFGANDV